MRHPIPSPPDPANRRYTFFPARFVVDRSSVAIRVVYQGMMTIPDRAPKRVSPVIEEKFRALTRQWQEETMKFSSAAQITSTFSYAALCAMGKEILPLIFRELEAGAGHWFTALRAINYPENPVQTQDIGNRKKMAGAWLRWARNHGYY